MTETTDLQSEFARPAGVPLIAMLAGCAVLVVGTLALPHLAPPQPLDLLLEGGIGAGFALWIAGLVFGIRRAPPVWIAGSLVLLLLAGALAGLSTHRLFAANASGDASSFAEIEFGPDGTPRLPPHIDRRGPISRLYAESVTADARDTAEYQTQLGALGLAALGSPYLLQQNPTLLGHCPAIAAVNGVAATHDAHRRARIAALAAAVAASNFPDTLKRGVQGMVAPDAGDAIAAQQAALIDTSAAQCRLLARRSWYNDGGYFGFRSAADADAYAALHDRQRTILAGIAAAQHARVEKQRAAQQIVRDALS